MDEQTGLATRSLTDPADVFCERCGYNLRGQDGDIRRCPECGLRNRVIIPYRAVHLFGDKHLSFRSRPRTPEDRPAACVLIAIFMMPFIVVFASAVFATVVSGVYGTGECILFSGFLTFILAVFWFIEASHFARDCRRRPGWFRVLLLYHVAALVPVGMLLVSGCYVSVWANSHVNGLFVYSCVNYVGLVVMPVVAVAVILPAKRWLQPWIRRQLASVIRVGEIDETLSENSVPVGPTVPIADEITPISLTQTCPVQIRPTVDAVPAPNANPSGAN